MRLVINQRRKKYILLSAIVGLVILTFPVACHAIEWKDIVDVVMGGIASLIVSALGAISGVVIGSIISIAKYNNFVGQEEIKTAWAIVRDISNMFFILILLLIAFATILRVETYNMKRWLPKLLIMAVLINFSKTICGIMIDFSQVIMLTFVNTFATNGATFVATLQMKNFINNVQAAKSETISLGSATVAYLLACIFMLVAIIALTAILIVFLMRLIMLWILVTLSPLAFMLSTFPQGQPYASQYWGQFTKYLVNGPVLAFFIWLALSVSGNIDANSITSDTSIQGLKTGVIGVLKLENFLSFILSIGFLAGGLMVSSQIGGIGASWGASTARSLGNKGLNMTKSAVKGTFRGAVTGLDWVNRKQAANLTGFDFNMSRQADRIKASFQRQKQSDLGLASIKATEQLRKGGARGFARGFTAPDWADNYVSGFLGKDGFRQVIKGSDKKVEELRKKEVKYAKLADNTRSQTEHDKYTERLTLDHEKALANGDKTGAKKIEDDLKWLSENEKDIVRLDEDSAKKLKNEYRQKQEEHNLAAGKITIQDFYGKQAEDARIAEESKKITTTNEDEISSQFQVATAQKKEFLAQALALHAAKIGAVNTLLINKGYNASAGLTEGEAKDIQDKEISGAVAKGTYDAMKGFNDFMRDIFSKQLRMTNQSYLALQSKMADIGRDTGHHYLMDTVGYRRDTGFFQRNERERETEKLNNKGKREAEGKIRNFTRTGWGKEDVNGVFRWDASGLADFISCINTVDKEIDGQRFNKNMAAKLVQSEEALNNLAMKLKELYKDEEAIGKDKLKVDGFIEKLKRYSIASSEDNKKKLLVFDI